MRRQSKMTIGLNSLPSQRARIARIPGLAAVRYSQALGWSIPSSFRGCDLFVFIFHPSITIASNLRLVLCGRERLVTYIWAVREATFDDFAILLKYFNNRNPIQRKSDVPYLQILRITHIQLSTCCVRGLPSRASSHWLQLLPRSRSVREALILLSLLD